MYSLVCTDYLWHQIAAQARLPLGLSGDQALAAYSAHEVQHLMLKAIRLDRNWRRPLTEIKRVISFALVTDPGRGAVDEVEFCGHGSDWLVASQRNRPQSRATFSFWSLRDVHHIYRVAAVEIKGDYKNFAVVLDECRKRATLATTVSFDDNA